MRTWADFIYSRSGPMLNAALLPWLILGIVVALATLGQFYSRCMLLWAGLLVIPVPILTNLPVARVYYPGLPAVYGLIGLGIFVFVRHLDDLFEKRRRWVWLTALGLALGELGVMNSYVYFNEVSDETIRLVRREMGDFVAQDATTDAHWFLPHLPGFNQPLFVETGTVQLYLRSKLSAAQAERAYEALVYADFLPKLLAPLRGWRTGEVLLDKSSEAGRDQRDQVAATLERCFPLASRWAGVYFDRYQLNASALAQPDCLPVALTLSTPGIPTVTKNSLTPKWSLSSGAASAVRQVCELARPGVTWVEAEDVTALGGWRSDVTLTSGWSGVSFVLTLMRACLFSIG